MKQRYLVLAMLVVLSTMTFIDRLAIAVLGPRIQTELRIPPDRWGWVLGAFVLACGLFEIPSGAAGDRHGHRRELTRIVVWWSIFMTITAACFRFWQLVVVRFLFGAGEAGAFPNATGVIGRWFPLRERARAQSWVWAGSRLGGVITPLLLVPLQNAFGWRRVFVLLGAGGIVWAVVWAMWFRNSPQQSGRITQQELDEIYSAATLDPHPSIPWRELLRSRSVWSISLAYGCYAWASWFYMAWFPTWIIRGAHFSERAMALVTALPFLCGVIGNLAGGILGDRLVERCGLKTGRRLVLGGAMAITAVVFAALALVHDKTAIIVLAAAGFGVMDLMLPSAWALCMDIGGRFSGTVSGVMNTAGQFGGLICTVLFGYIVRATGSYQAPIGTIAVMLLVSAILFSRVDATQRLERVSAVTTIRTL